jgi:exodeoxyribonuclease VII large subunit
LDTGVSTISVAELGRRLRAAVEQTSAGHWVEAELGSVKPAASGHVYFTLKDEREDAIVEAVMYRTAAQRVARHLFQGSKVQVWGKATVWVPRGRLQFVVERLRPAGRGALLEALERLKQKLIREGMFSSERKRPLPAHPKVVGVVTSAHGAAWHDIRTVAMRRGAVRLLLAPALVQGDGAPESIVSALNAIARVAGLDVVILGRGGGSLEDLMAFNDERVVRAVAAMPCPVVSAVGHEIDMSLCDLAADRRAATPSEAAELVVPDTRELFRRMLEMRMRMVRAMRSRVLEDRQVLHRLRAALSDPRFVLAEKQQEVDDWTMRLERVARRFTQQPRRSLALLERRLANRHPRKVLGSSRSALEPLRQRLRGLLAKRVSAGRGHASVLEARLLALSPLAVLSRGYAITLTEQGQVVRRSTDTWPGAALRVLLHEGALEVEVKGLVASTQGENRDEPS